MLHVPNQQVVGLVIQHDLIAEELLAGWLGLKLLERVDEGPVEAPIA